MVTSRHSYDVYKTEMKRIREKSKQYAYTHEYFRKTALTSFKTILDALRREYENGQVPLLATLLRTHCMIDPELLDYWDFFLFDSLANATLDMQREIVEKAGKKPHISFSDAHVSTLLNQINKLHQRYLGELPEPPKAMAAPAPAVDESALREAREAVAALERQKLDLEKQAKALQEQNLDLAEQQQELQAAVNEMEATRSAMYSEERKTARGSLDALKQERQALEKQKKTLQKEIAALEAARSEVDDYRAEQEELTETVEYLRRETDTLEDQKEALKKEKKALQQEIADLEAARSELGKREPEPEEAPETLDSIRQEADAALEAEKAWMLEEFERETGFRYRFDGTAAHNDEVREMVAGRKGFEEELVATLNATNRCFRDSTSEAANALTAACESLRKTLEQQTNSAINAVVDTSRRLQGTDFRDLLEGFRSLETQLYYKSRSGTETPEFKEYWKNVRFFLKKLENTLNKLGFMRYLPEEGAELDPDTMEALETDDDFPADPEEYSLFTVKEIVSGGFMDKAGEFPELKALVVAQYKEDA